MDTVVCYLKKNDKYLMLYRNKKEIDINKGKWITVGGHIEKGESPSEAMIREVKEESGYDVKSFKYLGEVRFHGDFEEIMHIFISDKFAGDEIECDEGVLSWFSKEEVLNLNMWDGDYRFINNVFEEKSIDLDITYIEGILQ